MKTKLPMTYLRQQSRSELRTLLQELQADQLAGCLQKSLIADIDRVERVLRSLHTYTVEYTDTFAGEANYSWVTRRTIEAPDNLSDLAIVRRAKRALDMQGVSCKREDWSDTIVLRPRGSCTIIFIEMF